MAAARALLLGVTVLVFFAIVVVAARVCRPGGRTWQRLAPPFFRVLLRLLRIRLVVTGDPTFAGAPVLLVANHTSWLDPLVFGALAPFTMLAKREIGSWPVIASFARLQGTVLVDRARRMQVPAVNRALAERLTAGRSILFFPEGTTYDGTRRGRFLTSHLACLSVATAGHPDWPARAQAATLRYSDPAAAWVGDATLLPHLWTILRRPSIECHVAFGAARPVPLGYDRKALGRQLAEDVESLLAAGTAAVESAEHYDNSQNSPADSAIVAGRVNSQAAPTCQSVAG